MLTIFYTGVLNFGFPYLVPGVDDFAALKSVSTSYYSMHICSELMI